jgi:membrane protease subunit HflC
MEAYRTALASSGTTMVLKPDGEFFRYFGSNGSLPPGTAPSIPAAPATPGTAPAPTPTPQATPPEATPPASAPAVAPEASAQ